MVELQTAQLDAVFHALRDATRRRMLRELSREPMTVSRLAQPFDMSLAAASKHIQVLERARLVERRKVGREHFLSYRPEPLDEAAEWIARTRTLWATRLDALDRLLREEDGPTG